MTRKVGVCWDAAFQAHSAGVGHPERAERLNSIREILDADGTWERLIQVPTRRATKEELERKTTWLESAPPGRARGPSDSN